jgi:hypothetical protein
VACDHEREFEHEHPKDAAESVNASRTWRLSSRFHFRSIYARNVTRTGEHPRMRTKLEAASALAVFITGFSAGKE